ncbi:MAG: hypothetical protein AAGB48_03625 [Planctomycetota bacterium]
MRAHPGRFRPILTTVIVVLLLLAGWLVVEAYFALTARPNVDTDYGAQLEALAASVQPDGPDRWWAYEEAVESFRTELKAAESAMPTGWAELSLDLSVVYDAEFWSRNAIRSESYRGMQTEDALAAIEAARDSYIAWLRGEGGRALGRVMALRSSDARFVSPWPREGMLIEQALFMDLGAAREVARGLGAAGVLAIDSADWAAYLETVESSLWLSSAISYQPTLIHHLVATAIRSLMLEHLVRRPLMDGLLPADVLAEVHACLGRWPIVGPAHALHGERLWVMDAIQHTHDTRGRAIVAEQQRILRGLSPDDQGVPRILNMISVFVPRRVEAERAAEGYFDLAIQDIERPASEQWRAGSRSEAFETFADSSSLFGALLPAFGSFYMSVRQHELDSIGVRTLIAMERCRLETGSLPATLDDLVPTYLDAVPIDPLADPDGTPLRYVVLDEPDAVDRRYLLYSVGLDRTDDGGVQAQDVRFAALRPGNEGTDFVINASEPSAE